ncbi:serine/arginine repetitive matrix protein 1-like [Armigeres subalbatus]|uniref:serine/arginine repetitive matrix protein 1-like n=1 Tax=Armigeres subalbatus TaxID=124917 RepID=UPI002ECFBEED
MAFAKRLPSSNPTPARRSQSGNSQRTPQARVLRPRSSRGPSPTPQASPYHQEVNSGIVTEHGQPARSVKSRACPPPTKKSRSYRPKSSLNRHRTSEFRPPSSPSASAKPKPPRTVQHRVEPVTEHRNFAHRQALAPLPSRSLLVPSNIESNPSPNIGISSHFKPARLHQAGSFLRHPNLGLYSCYPVHQKPRSGATVIPPASGQPCRSRRDKVSVSRESVVTLKCRTEN